MILFAVVSALVCGIVDAQQLLVPPYLQPGNNPGLSREGKMLIWQTDSVPGEFKVEYAKGSLTGDVKVFKAKISSVKLFLNNKTTFLYRAKLSKLQFDEAYTYRVSLSGKTIAENSFPSRSKKPATQFAVFGDGGAGTRQQAQIAYQIYQKKPQFVLITGDVVYPDGLEHEYRKNFFPYYNASDATPEKGAPLMSKTPFYAVLGNHDVRANDLDKNQGGLAYFYYNDLPTNAPVPKLTVKVNGQVGRVKTYKMNTSRRFPKMSNFSFDYGNLHFVCLDANLYVNPLDPYLVEWMKRDLQATKADWKIVAYHDPGFNTSKAHYDDQQMRLLTGLLEEYGVDMVLAGHVHNYQRSLPLKFSPGKNADETQYLITPEGRVNGDFVLDQKFDGNTDTTPEGIIYIVTGAGGAPLYDPELSEKPDLWKHDLPENWASFTVKMISNKHSFTWIETEGKKLKLQQLDVNGVLLDEITMTK